MPPLVKLIGKARTSLRTILVSASGAPSRKRYGSSPSRNMRRASRSTTGWAQLPPIQPVIVPSAWTIACAPGFADVGRSHQTTVATTKGSPACVSRYASSSRFSIIAKSSFLAANLALPYVWLTWMKVPRTSLPARGATTFHNLTGSTKCSGDPCGRQVPLATRLHCSPGFSARQVSLIRSQALFLQDTPHLPGRDRNIYMPYANMRERIDNGISNCLRSAHSRRFANTFGPYRMMRRRCNRFIGLPVWCLHRGGDQVVLEVARQNVAILIKRDLLIHRWGKALRQATMDLPPDNHRIDDRTAVIYRHEAAYMHLPGTPVDVHNTDVATERICEVGGIIIVHRLQTRLQVRRAVRIGRKRQLLDGLTLARRSLHIEAPRLPLQILLAYFQQVCRNLFGLVAHFPCSHRRRSAGHRRTAAGIGAQSIRSSIRDSMLDIDIVRRHPEFCGDDLRKGRFMSLPLRLHADAGENLAGGMDANLAAIEHLNACNVEMFVGASAHDLRKGGDADAHQFTTRTLFGLLAAQPLVVYILHGQPECSFIVATIKCPVQGRTIGEGFGLDEVL